jgi:hypothetical protein
MFYNLSCNSSSMDTKAVLKIHSPLHTFFILRRGLSCLETFPSLSLKQSSRRNETEHMQTTFPFLLFGVDTGSFGI